MGCGRFLARFLNILPCRGRDVPSTSSRTHSALPRAFLLLRPVPRRIRGPLQKGVRVLPADYPIRFLLDTELLRPEWPERILAWRHTGFSVHSKVRAKTRKEAGDGRKYMIRPLLSLERLSLDEREAKVCYQYGEGPEEADRMDYLDLIARVTSPIPDKGQVTVRYYGLYANAHRGKMKKSSLGPLALRMVEEELRRPLAAAGPR